MIIMQKVHHIMYVYMHVHMYTLLCSVVIITVLVVQPVEGINTLACVATTLHVQIIKLATQFRDALDYIILVFVSCP